MPKMSNIAVAYLRMSTDRQEYSLESQWRVIAEWATRNNYTIVKRYEDAGVSAMESKLSKRTGFLQMVDDSEDADWSAVIVYDSSRFSRSLRDSIVYKSILKENGVQVISVTEPVIDEDTALIMDAINGAQNEMYIRKLSKNVRRGYAQKALRGELLNQPPFGYRRGPDRRQIVIVPEEAQIVRYIYAQYLAGKSAYIIAKDLSQSGVKTTCGNPFDTRQIKRILSSPTYKGMLSVTVGGQHYEYPDAWEAIIPPVDFDQAQQITADRQSNAVPKVRAPELHSHWLAGRLRCGACGACYYRRSNRARQSPPQFMCINRAHASCHDSPIIVDYLLEEAFFEAVDRFLSTDDAYQEKQLSLPPPPVETDYSLLIQKAERSLKRAREAYLAEIDTLEEYKAAKSRLEAEIASLLEQQNHAEHRCADIPKTKAAISGLVHLLRDSSVPMETKCRAFEKVVEKVIIYPDRSLSIIFYGILK